MNYDPPVIIDMGDLVELTAGCVGTGPPDAMLTAGYPDTSPALGDPAFCA